VFEFGEECGEIVKPVEINFFNFYFFISGEQNKMELMENFQGMIKKL
jgi:hypothetical protein